MHTFPAVELIVGLMMLLTLWARVDAAPTVLIEPGYAEPPDPSSRESTAGAKSEPATDRVMKQLKPSRMTTNPSSGDKEATAISGPDKRGKMEPVTSSPSRRAQMLKMLSALEELHRVMNSTLSARFTMMPRANSKNSGKKSKLVAVDDKEKTPTVPPVEAAGTVSNGHIDLSSLSGRAFKKSLPPQPKKPNKRVCFWKYCSQN